MRVREITEIFNPEELIEIRGTTSDEDFVNAIGPYYELRDKELFIFTRLFGLASLIFLTYLIYHVISKIRGNEKNVPLNTYGIGLSLLMLVNYSILFTDESAVMIDYGKWLTWKHKHETLYWWIIWSSDSTYFLYHWLFNWRYVKSTFRLPVLQKSAEFHSKKLDKIIKQREDQHVLFSP